MSIFTSIRGRRPRKNKFDLSHERKFSFRMGDLTPILVQDVVPGDSFRVKSELFLRMAPMLAPIMHRVNVYTHYFFVPNRLVWNEWEDFITGGKEGTSEPVWPHYTFGGGAMPLVTKGSLCDYMGLPIAEAGGVSNTTGISALPFRAYQLIYNEYYRDQNLSDPVEFSLDSGNRDSEGDQEDVLFKLRKRAWEKDYFTSALPWAQRGGEVHMPIEGEASWTYKNPTIRVDGASPSFDRPISREPDGMLSTSGATGSGINPVTRIDNIESIEIENAQTTINDLRRSVRLQEWLEKNARGGARYVEQILSHFGVRSSDARLQRPEYLGGGKQPVQISEVLSTFQEETGNPQGSMAGHGVAVGSANGFRKFFEEHGYVIGLVSVLPKTAYQQGIPRHLSRSDRFDYYWPEFAQIGEQEVKNKELYWSKAMSNEQAEGTFGYQSRYAEYKYQPSTVHGEMKDTLSFWHMGRIFNSAPSLNENFVMSNPTERIFAVQDQEHMYCQLYNKVDAIRPMPYFGTPTL